MDIEQTELEGCYILTPKVFGDERGSFSVTFKVDEVERLGFQKTIQDNMSISQKGVLRGMHFQEEPDTQAKIVWVDKGAVIDVVVDMRKDSKTYGKYTSVLLTKENRKQLYVPRGFAHGYLCLQDFTEFKYKVDNVYSPKKDGGILWNDPNVGIPWKQWCDEYGIDYDKILLKEADQTRPLLKDSKTNFYRKYRYLVTGATGQLGYDVVRELHSRGIYDVLAFSSEEMDITNIKCVAERIEYYRPEVIIHCAAYTDVKKAEISQDIAYKVNALGTSNLSVVADIVGAKLLYISTDYVFDGKKGEPYEIFDQTNPLNVYGESKLAGEQRVRRTCPRNFIVRTSWVFGSNSKTPNFIQNILKQAKEKDELIVVDDQLGSPTYTVDLAKFLVDLSQTDCYGLYQAHNEGYCSWYDLASFALQEAGISIPIKPIQTNMFPSTVERPMDSRMSTVSLSDRGFELLPDWEDAVKRYVKELKKN